MIENCAKHAGMPVGPLAITDELSIDLSSMRANPRPKEFPEEYKPGRSVPVIGKLFELGRPGPQRWARASMTTMKAASASGRACRVLPAESPAAQCA